ncbi:muscle M-line assembly protein unc-89 [Diabrotica virgifera virgifera]|uniref:Hemicentin-1 n=2 Tax=Diabrotica virgifera virgifera TaxID=50390 RepID=A0ABM5KHF6_DIAVI|nr:muscle M-line assembly protein unc-89 [Diabrotica virgifera virgifera]
MDAKGYLTVVFLLVSFVTWAVSEDSSRDTREGEDVTLECRFPPQPSRDTLTYYWAKNNKQTHDNVAIGHVPLDANYKINYRVDKGIYDLSISNASYDRDNGKFECKVKAGGSGTNLHVQKYTLTVLTLPQQPVITPSSYVTVTEGKKQELTCSSIGGSPDPEVKWYRQGSQYPLETALRNGGSRDQPTTATLVINPTKEDDEAVFRCEVWNRALLDDKKLISTMTLSVNYFPRVEIGPENPLRVERDSQATLRCSVDAKPKVTTIRWTRNNRFISSSYNHTIHRVSVQDAGKYTCMADNGLGKVGEQEITLDVLYPPIVTLEAKTKEAEEGESVFIKCNISANPDPITVEWVKDGKPDFRFAGDTLTLSHVTAEHSGTYICRAVNIISPSAPPLRMNEKVGNASIALLVRHHPGRARIMPDKPVATEGSPVTLTCTATPPGWPAPQYRWFRIDPSGQTTILATGTKYTIPSASLVTEGIYHCQATNELGPGELASVSLEVHVPPSFKSKLKPLEIKRVGDSGFVVACSARGKPRPMVKWLKDEEELTPDANMFEVKTDYVETSNGAVSVQSILKFSGKARPNGNELLPSDRGVYSCMFENEVKRTESTMHLKIEHEPIVLHHFNKVAYDLSEHAEVVCKVQAFPKPEFKWFYGANINPLHSSSEGHYVVHSSSDEDIYTSVLKINKIERSDYGEYTCQVINNLGAIDTKIKLQPKGAPEKPSKLASLYDGFNFVTLGWEPGFNGGISNTKYVVYYRKIASDNDIVIEGCNNIPRSVEWNEVDCFQSVPCNVSHLEQYQTYLFKVKAINTKGSSENSQEIRERTRVNKIPQPQSVEFDKNSNTLGINVPATCLPLVAVVETVSNENHPITAWQVIDTMELQVSGLAHTFKEKSLDQMGSKFYNGRALIDEPIGVNDDYVPRIRVKLCLQTHPEHCGEFVDAEFGTGSIREASAMTTPTVIAIVVACIVLILFAGLLLVFCRCRKTESSKKAQSKDYEMDSVQPTIVPQQNQAPPPYYPSSGMDNKALEHSLDLALALEDQKSVYATQNGYGYHVANADIQARQNINNTDWANMGYIENSYSNSNNGGSVNSQDSLWQMKMAAASSNSNNQLQQHHMNVDRQNYGYDPITHGGYGAVDDYAPYPHITTQSNHGDEYIRNSNNPSRQDYCSDPYASVHKPKKRVEIESPYHDVSGLPDPYLEQMEDEKPPQHMSLSYEESLESGYSTPNSRTRRVIREIIV